MNIVKFLKTNFFEVLLQGTIQQLSSSFLKNAIPRNSLPIGVSSENLIAKFTEKHLLWSPFLSKIVDQNLQLY